MACPVCGSDAIPRKPPAHSRKVVGGSSARGHAHSCRVEDLVDKRVRLESALIEAYQPPLNDALK